METAISKKKAAELQKIFESTSKPSGYKASINVNSIITDDQEAQYSKGSKDREEKLN